MLLADVPVELPSELELLDKGGDDDGRGGAGDASLKKYENSKVYFLPAITDIMFKIMHWLHSKVKPK